MGKRIRLNKEIEKVLEKLPDGAYRLEDGGKHFKLYVYDRMAGVIPHNQAKDGAGRGYLNVISQIRKIVAEKNR